MKNRSAVAIGALLLAVTCLLGASSQKDKLEEQLLHDAGKALGFELPKRATHGYPIVYHTTRRMVEWVVCKNAGCSALAASYYNAIYLAYEVDLTTTLGQSILFHEMVHALQYFKYGEPANCQEWARREMVAYSLQDEWAQKRGYYDPHFQNIQHRIARFCVEP